MSQSGTIIYNCDSKLPWKDPWGTEEDWKMEERFFIRKYMSLEYDTHQIFYIFFLLNTEGILVRNQSHITNEKTMQVV